MRAVIFVIYFGVTFANRVISFLKRESTEDISLKLPKNEYLK